MPYCSVVGSSSQQSRASLSFVTTDKDTVESKSGCKLYVCVCVCVRVCVRARERERERLL